MSEVIKQKSALREIPYMGVIWVVSEAMKLGFYNGNPDWSNLGQGQPEIGEMEGAPDRIRTINIEPGDQAYGHIGGTDDFCEVIANHYNRLYRQGKKSKYTKDNVCVAMGGRLVLSRVFAALDKGRLGYQVPDYTAYEDMMNYQEGRVKPILIPTIEENGFGIPGHEFANTIRENDLNAYVLSNPCNPTGNLIEGDELETYVKAAREEDCTLINDEFYSHFIYDGDKPGQGGVSAAEFVDDVDSDPVIIIDGLTKSFRYPGWRIGWAVGPKDMMDTLGRAASAIDGGPSQPMQRAGIQVLEEARADQETEAVRNVFSRKKNLMMASLKRMGIRCSPEPNGTFYIWADISNLPEAINDADDFFREALKVKVMTVPGHFFDVNPGQNKREENPFKQWLRFSYGPPEDNVIMGLKRLEEMVASFK